MVKREDVQRILEEQKELKDIEKYIDDHLNKGEMEVVIPRAGWEPESIAVVVSKYENEGKWTVVNEGKILKFS